MKKDAYVAHVDTLISDCKISRVDRPLSKDELTAVIEMRWAFEELLTFVDRMSWYRHRKESQDALNLLVKVNQGREHEVPETLECPGCGFRESAFLVSQMRFPETKCPRCRQYSLDTGFTRIYPSGRREPRVLPMTEKKHD